MDRDDSEREKLERGIVDAAQRAAMLGGGVGELVWKGDFVDMTVRFMTINGDGLEFNFPIGMAYTVLLVPTHQAIKAAIVTGSAFAHGCERAFIGVGDVDLYLQGISAAMMAFGDCHFPPTFEQLKFRLAQKVADEDG